MEAELYPDTGRNLFYLRVDPEPRGGWSEATPSSRAALARHRSRFRIAHELGHTFFYERRKGQCPRRTQRWSRMEEEWCDEFARRLLVPAAAARAAKATASSVFRLQRRFDVSLEVAARALAGVHEKATVAVWFWPADTDEPRECLLRQWVSCETTDLHRWRESTVVARALVDGESSGPLADFRRPSRQLAATARCGRRRRQVVVVAG